MSAIRLSIVTYYDLTYSTEILLQVPVLKLFKQHEAKKSKSNAKENQLAQAAAEASLQDDA